MFEDRTGDEYWDGCDIFIIDYLSRTGVSCWFIEMFEGFWMIEVWLLMKWDGELYGGEEGRGDLGEIDKF